MIAREDGRMAADEQSEAAEAAGNSLFDLDSEMNKINGPMQAFALAPRKRKTPDVRQSFDPWDTLTPRTEWVVSATKVHRPNLNGR